MQENIDILLKLFETLKDASDKNEDATQQLIVQQYELVSHIKNMPIDDLRLALKEHSKESGDSIDSCTETVETTTSDLMEAIRLLAEKVGRMILVVVVAFSLLTGGYFVIRYAADDEAKWDKLQQQIEERQDKEHSELVEELKEELRNIRNEDFDFRG